MKYNYRSLREMDFDTYDYLKFVFPKPINNTPMSEINEFLTKLDTCYLDMHSNIEYVVSTT